MKARPFLAPRVLVASAAQLRTVLRGFGCVARRHWWSLPVVAVLSVLLAWVFFPLDSGLLDRLHALYPAHDDEARRIAWFFGTFGDYPTYNLPLALIIWIFGVVTKSTACRRLAVVAFLGATLAGLFDDCFRLSLGRARPDAHMADQFYGPAYAFRGGFQSFPSGHAASTFGTALALLLTEWRLGVLTTIIACGVIWARMELYRHYPSDVVVGSIIGMYFGLIVGYGAKLRRRAQPLDSHAGSH